jgi:hypothetical protein
VLSGIELCTGIQNSGLKIENFIAVDDLTKTFAIVPLSG